jgi:hypothetical protein
MRFTNAGSGTHGEASRDAQVVGTPADADAGAASAGDPSAAPGTGAASPALAALAVLAAGAAGEVAGGGEPHATRPNAGNRKRRAVVRTLRRGYANRSRRFFSGFRSDLH